MDIFEPKHNERKELRSMLISVLICVFLIVFLFIGFDNVATGSSSEQLHIAERAVRRAIVQCYALEGHYPQSLDYVAANYGLILDHNRFIYHYAPVGGNLMPQIRVFAK